MRSKIKSDTIDKSNKLTDLLTRSHCLKIGIGFMAQRNKNEAMVAITLSDYYSWFIKLTPGSEDKTRKSGIRQTQCALRDWGEHLSRSALFLPHRWKITAVNWEQTNRITVKVWSIRFSKKECTILMSLRSKLIKFFQKSSFYPYRFCGKIKFATIRKTTKKSQCFSNRNMLVVFWKYSKRLSY